MNTRKRPFEFIERWLRRQRNEHFLKKWTTRRDGDPTGKYYVKRHYEFSFAFYDLYWYIKSTESRQRVYTHYIRIGEDSLISKIKDVEQTQLPSLFDNITMGGGDLTDNDPK